MNQWKHFLLKFWIKNDEISTLWPPAVLPKEITYYLRIFADFLSKQKFPNKVAFLLGDFNVNALE